MSFFSTIWTELIRDLLPWASRLFQTASFLGSEYFFVALIAIGYWTIDKRSSKQVALLLLFSSATNYWLKIIIKHPRPPVSNWIPGTTASNYSLPSGHTQNSTTIWGWFGIQTKDTWKRIVYIVTILLVSFSRIYLGVHWFGDILFGWFVGAVILGVTQILEKKGKISVIDSIFFNLGLVLFGVIVVVGTEFLSPVTLPGVEDNFGAIGGLIIGMGVGFILEDRYVKFEIDSGSPYWRSVLRIIIGLCLVFIVMIGLSGFLVSEHFWLRAIRYIMVAIIALFVWPYIFTKMKI